MKRDVFIFLLAVLLVNFVVAIDPPETGIGVEDKEAIEGAIDKIPIDPSTGEIDFNNTIGKTKAEERIERINSWLSDNASWMDIVLGMKPEVSWVFLINLYFWLLFLLVLAINENSFSLFLSEGKARLVGLCLFIILLVIKFYLSLAKIIYNLIDVLWNIILPLGIIAIIIFAAILIVIAIYFPKIFAIFKRFAATWKSKREGNEEAFNRESLKRIVKGATED